MNRTIGIALIGTMLGLALGYALLRSTSYVAAPSSGLTVAPSASLSAGTKRTAAPTSADRAGTAPSYMDADSQTRPLIGSPDETMTPLSAAESEWAQAAVIHQQAERALKTSEQALSEVERDIEAVERFIEDLEERGDDPADFAEEGMAKLEPAIERFEARLDIVERNERLEVEARARLDLAEAELARQQSTSP